MEQKHYGPPLCMAEEMKEEGNPDCHCLTPLAAMFCMTGHMTECHYPMSCEEAQCGHLKLYD